MKIGFVLDDSLDKSDGVQQYVLTLGTWFHSQGHEVHYLVGHTERTDVHNIHSLSRTVQLRFNQNRVATPRPASSKKIHQILEAEEFDVIHVQMPHSPLLAARVVKQASQSTAVFGTFHIIPYSRLEATAARILRILLRRNLKRFDKIYSVSVPAQRFARKAFKLRTRVLPNVVNLQRYAAEKPLRQYQDDTITIVFLGRLVERKGCMHLLKAVNRLHQKHQTERIRVLICGKGPLKPSLEAYVHAHHLGHIVRFIGFVDEKAKARYLASADIAVFPSTGGESFGIVLIESMAAGAGVVIGGNNLGYKSVLGAQPEALFDPSDTDEFAKSLHHFISSKRARSVLHKRQQESVKAYDVRTVGSKLLKDYETAIAKRNKNTDNSM